MCRQARQGNEKPELAWIGLCSVLRPHQHSIGYMGDGFYRSKDPTNGINVTGVDHKNTKRQSMKLLTWFEQTELMGSSGRAETPTICHSLPSPFKIT